MKSRGGWRIAAALAGCGVLILCVALCRESGNSFQGDGQETAIYVWQESWNPSVGESINQHEDLTRHLMLFAAELRIEAGTLRTLGKSIDWPSLRPEQPAITLVIRGGDRVVRRLGDAKAREEVAQAILTAFRAASARAHAAGLAIRGLQLDFDCPTARLADYQQLVKAVRPQLPALEFSITALPDWLNSSRLRALVQPLDYFVLQVHSIKAPRSIDQAVSLVDWERLPRDLARASAVSVPFFVALPTYGYRLFFDAEGKCLGLGQEGAQVALKPGMRMTTVSADPVALADLVHTLQSQPPAFCRGIVWFRLPVAGDQFNWPWPTLQAVAQGRAPSVSLQAELRQPSPGLYEVWLTNAGEARPVQKVSIPVTLGPVRPLASDALAGWSWSPARDRLNGPAPPLGAESMVAWFRLMPNASAQSTTTTLGKVEYQP